MSSSVNDLGKQAGVYVEWDCAYIVEGSTIGRT